MQIYDGELILNGNILVSYRRFGVYAIMASTGTVTVAGQAVTLTTTSEALEFLTDEEGVLITDEAGEQITVDAYE